MCLAKSADEEPDDTHDYEKQDYIEHVEGFPKHAPYVLIRSVGIGVLSFVDHDLRLEPRAYVEADRDHHDYH